jgi:hypothetical protein
MSDTSQWLLLWAPRILSLVICAFLGLFALDAFGPGKPAGEALVDFAIHLIPAAVVLTLSLLSWRWPQAGGAGFVALALIYATTMGRGRLDWILAIAGPLLVVGLLFLCSAAFRTRAAGA